jgi:hypothetical protein
MTSDHALEFMIHATVFRLSVIAVGAMLAYLGYRLFVLGVMTDAGGLDAAAGVIKLKLTKAAPGTFFALFGAVLIRTTVMEGAPQYDHAITKPSGYSTTVNLRGSDNSPLDTTELFARLSDPNLTLSAARPFLHQLAIARRNDNRIAEAYVFSQLATNFESSPIEMWMLEFELAYRLGKTDYGDELKLYLLAEFPTEKRAIEDIVKQHRK